MDDLKQHVHKRMQHQQSQKKDEWLPQSLNCNPMDYCVWNSLREKVYEGQMATFTKEELLTKIKACWEKITLEEIQSCILYWRKQGKWKTH